MKKVLQDAKVFIAQKLHQKFAMMISIRIIVIESAIWLLWALLSCIDLILVNFIKIYSPWISKGAAGEATTNKPKVVIVGASFAGLATEHALSHHSNELDITIVDFKEYFEYVPGALRCFIEPEHFTKSLSCPLSVLLEKHATTVVTGEVVDVYVADNTKTNKVILRDGRVLPYDYLVLAAGSTYPVPIKSTPNELTLQQRQAQWNQAAAELDAAKTVVILGAGAVGVELAAEILTKYPSSKRVLLVDLASQILPGFRDSSVKYATEWLKTNGAELKLGSPLKHLDDKSVTFADGKTLQVDLLYKCVGVAPNTGFLKQGALSSSLKGPRGSMVVNDHLQLEGFGHVFCAGDMCFHARSDELKLGHTAEVNAHLVSENVLRLVRSRNAGVAREKLLTYPEGVVGNVVTPQIYDLSLGKYDATLGFNSLVLNGGLAAVVKWLLEWTKVAAASQRPVGIIFWFIADFVSNLLGRTVLPTPMPKNKKH